jgi:hypothetical protein
LILSGRKYKSGAQWCLWRWTQVDSEYIVRLHLIKTPWFAVCLHWIKKPDPEPYLHDHPVTFLSVVLRGEYREQRGFTEGQYNGHGPKRRRWFNFVRATDGHTIDRVSPGGCLTVAFMGPKVREWGFHTPTGWIYWKDYYAGLRAKRWT